MDDEKKALLPKDGQDEEKLLINNDEPPFALTMAQKLLYGLPFMSQMAFLGIQGVWMTYFYLPPEDSGNKPIVDTALFAMVTFIVRLLAGFLSPFVGHLSDNTSTRIGKRIPYILVGVPLFAIFQGLLWWVPFERESVGASIYFTVVYTMSQLGFLIYLLPYTSLVQEITPSPKERIQISMMQGLFGLLGSASIAAIGPLNELSDTENWRISGVQISGIAISVLVVILHIPVLLVIKENVDEPSIKKATENPNVFIQFKESFQNKAFVCVIIWMGMFLMAVSNLQAAEPYLFTAVLETENGIIPIGKGESWLGIVSIVSLFAMGLGIGISSKLAAKFGKKRISIISTVAGIIIFVGTYCVQFLEDPALMQIPLNVIGVLFIGGVMSLPQPMLTDCIDEDFKKTGLKRSGLYFGGRSFIITTSKAIAAAIIPFVLEMGNTAENPSGIMTLFLIGAGYITISLIALLFYPLK